VRVPEDEREEKGEDSATIQSIKEGEKAL